MQKTLVNMKLPYRFKNSLLLIALFSTVKIHMHLCFWVEFYLPKQPELETLLTKIFLENNENLMFDNFIFIDYFDKDK